ncbi:CHASE domain-containing protein [Actomonas aquatica]|uniref:histidine kinase n=1 Tax=Actomonas aquatica TaxID=2866162 RepID=A0ABZ1C2E4_9BACT|nr:CHASE domain-containing protein [Opitutus sp. WL0086]WRQ85626.1 CHASE domain-containing protein [Opitutus sp. WL0086]
MSFSAWNAFGSNSPFGGAAASMDAPPRASWRLVIAGALLVWGLSELGLLVSSVSGMASPVWPAAGLGVWMVLRGGRRMLWGVVLGAFLSRVNTGLGAESWVAALGPGVEAWIGAEVIRRVGARTVLRSRRLAEVVSWLVAAVAGALPNMVLGVGILWGVGVVPTTDLPVVALTWWVGDVFGIVLLVSTLETWWRSRGEAEPLWRNLGRLAGLVGATVLAAGVALWPSEPGGWLFLLFPPLLLGKHWGGRMGVQLVVMLIAVAAVLATATGRGPFYGDQLNEGLLSMEVFLASVIATALALPLFRMLGTFRLGAVVLLTGWSLSAVVYHLHRRTEVRAEVAHLDAEVVNTMDALEDRMTIYVEALRAGEALFHTTGDVDAAQWRRFADALRLPESFPGIRGVGVIWPVEEADLPAFRVQMAAARAGDLAVHEVPGVERPVVAAGDPRHLVIGYIEPESANGAALGLDVGSEANRRAAALLARDSGEARLTRRIVLVQDGRKRAGFLLYLPVYANGWPTTTVAERRAAFRHWVYAPFVTESFVEGVLPSLTQELTLDLFEGSSTAPGDLLYAGGPTQDAGAAYAAVRELKLGGESFTLGWRKTEKFAGAGAVTSSWIGAGLALAVLAAAGMATLLQVSQQRAQVLVTERTTELEKAQAQMAELIALQRGVLDSNNFAFISVDLQGIIRSFNRGAERMLGYAASEVIGRRTPEGFHLVEEVEREAAALSRKFGEPVAADMGVFVALALRGLKDEREWTYVRSDGVKVPVKLSVTAIRNEAGEVTGFLGVAQDLTSHKQAEASRRAAMIELSMLKQALDQFVEISVSDLNGTILYANRKFCENSGYTHDELVGQNHSILNSGEHAPEFFRKLWKTIRGGYNWHGDICNRTKDGRNYWVDTLIVPELNVDGEVRRYVSIRIDVTRNREYEKGLAQARDDAIALSRLKSEFLANVSHELRTPMNGVIGMADMLSGMVTHPEHHRMIEVIRQSGENLLTIINDILDLSKVEAGKMRLSVADFDLATLLREAIELLVPRAESKHVALRCEIPPGSDWWVSGDEGRLRQVVINLLGNALKFTDAGTVSLRLRDLSSLSSRRQMRIEVEDTGCGIPADMLERLFESFVQVDGSDSRAQGGTGLGLSISRQIIELMGGRVGVESELGVGSTFWVELSLPVGVRPVPGGLTAVAKPAAVRAERTRIGSAETPAKEPSGPGPLEILLVEDNRANQEVATLMLRRMGHTVTVANNGQEGLDTLSVARFDVVLMDCQMPVLDGFTATRKLRAGDVPGVDPRIPVVALTAYAMEGDRQRCIDAGMDDYLTKPLRAREVTAALRGVVQRAAMAMGPARKTDGIHEESAADVLDEEVVAELCEIEAEPGLDVFTFVARGFVASWADELAVLAALRDEGEWEAFAQKVHQFGGSAATFGGQRVRRLAIYMEKRVKEGDRTAAQELWPELAEASRVLSERAELRMAELKTAVR